METDLPASNQTPSTEQMGDTDDSVQKDLLVAKTMFAKLSERVNSIFKPVISKGMSETKAVLVTAASTPKLQGVLKKLIKVAVLVVAVLLLINLGIAGYNYFKNGGQENPLSSPAPTSEAYRPTKPSIYSDDPEVLQVDENVNVLEREVAGAIIKETTLNPPKMDFEVSF